MWLEAVPWAGGALASLVVLHLTASWMERRGWIYYRKPGGKGYGAALSNAMAEFESVLSPAAEHRVIEERRQDGIRSVVDSDEPEVLTDLRRLP